MNVKINHLTCKYPLFRGVFRRCVGYHVAVDDVSLEIPEKKVVALVGESGSGKSTLARALVGILAPSSGEILLDGAPPDAALRKKIQIVFQDPYASLNPRKTIFQSVGEVLLYRGLFERGEAFEKAVFTLFDRVGLQNRLAYRYPHELSGGQQQRVSIGRAIASSPELLVLDEAVSALDVSVRAQILNLLEDLKEELGLSYLFITHDLSVVHHSADYVYILKEGRLVEEGTTEKIFERPTASYTKQLLEAIPATW